MNEKLHYSDGWFFNAMVKANIVEPEPAQVQGYSLFGEKKTVFRARENP
jgi:hypothetical protein